MGLLGLHIDDKAVWRIHRGGLPPAGDQVGAQQHEQRQRQQTDRQGADLHHRKHRSRGHLACGQAQPARSGLIGHHPAQQKQSRRRQSGKYQKRHGKTAHRDQAQGEVAADHEQGDGKAEQAHDEHQARAHLHASQVTADHAQRWHFGQLQHRRQAKGHQQRQAHGQAHQRGLGCGCGQIGIHQTRQQLHKTQVHAITGQHSQHTGHQACAQKFQAITQCECALALPQNPKQSTGIQLPLGKTSRRQGHGYSAKQGGQQGHQVQELRSPVQGLPHLGATTVQRLDLHATHIGLVGLGLRPRQKLAHNRIAPGHCHAPAHAAGRLDQARRGQIGHVHHHARCKPHEARAPVGLAGDGGANAQTALAQAQHLAHLKIQRFEQSRIDPDLTHRRNAGRALA